MHAILIKEGKALVWSEVPDPVIKGNEILVEVHAAALNRADLMQREGNYPPPPGWPEWMGLEVAGIVLCAPRDSRWKTGDKVCALLGGGGYAEKVAVPADMALPVPEGLSMVEAAAIPEVFATVYLNFVIEANVKPTDTVFIQAGASGLGIAAIQFVKNMGCKVITTVGSDEKANFVKGLGADIVVNRKTGDLSAVLEQNPVDITLDCVGGAGMGDNFSKMAPWGRWIQIAALAGGRTEIDLATVFRKRIRLIGSTLRSRTNEMKAQILHALQKTLWPKFSFGEIKPVIYKTLPITYAEKAHAILQGQKNLGKVVLTVK